MILSNGLLQPKGQRSDDFGNLRVRLPRRFAPRNDGGE